MATSIDAKFATMQSHLDALKAKLTPAEYLLQILQAQAAEAAVYQAVADAKAALDGLKAQQARRQRAARRQHVRDAPAAAALPGFGPKTVDAIEYALLNRG